MLINRLYPFLNDMVNPLQSSFIPGRGTTDNAIILQENIHYMKKSKRKKGDLIFKLDLEKAYDQVHWDFLRQTLQVFGFPHGIISLIMHGISSTSISLLWNGCATPYFEPKKGHKGDLLSPTCLFFAHKGLVLWSRLKCKSKWSQSLPPLCKILGLKISLEKSRVTNDRKDKILNITQIRFTSNLGKYLGFKIFQGRPKK